MRGCPEYKGKYLHRIWLHSPVQKSGENSAKQEKAAGRQLLAHPWDLLFLSFHQELPKKGQNGLRGALPRPEQLLPAPVTSMSDESMKPERDTKKY